MIYLHFNNLPVIRRARHLKRKLKQITNLVSIFNMNCTEFASVLYPQFRRLYQVVQMMIKGFQSYGEQNSVFRGQISLKRRGYKSDTGPCSTAIVPTLENTCCVLHLSNLFNNQHKARHFSVFPPQYSPKIGHTAAFQTLNIITNGLMLRFT